MSASIARSFRALLIVLVIALQLWFMGWGAIERPSNDAVMGGPSREPWLGRSLAAPTLADNGDNRSDRNGNGNDSGDDGTFRSPPIQPLSPLPPLQSSPRCTQTGSEAVFVSGDGKATLKVFPTMSLSLQVAVRPFYDLLALPPSPVAWSAC